MYKRILTIFTIVQILTYINATENGDNTKRVVCYYGVLSAPLTKNLRPEGIDASVCTDIILLQGTIDTETKEVVISSISEKTPIEEEGHIRRLVRLKEVNPNLKLHLFISSERIPWVLETEERRIRIIKSAIMFLNRTRFDGLNFATANLKENAEGVSSFFCEMHTELSKYGYEVSAVSSELIESRSRDSVVENISRCCSHLTILTVRDMSKRMDTTELIAPMNLTRSMVDKYVEKGFPANKLLISLPTFAIIVNLVDPQDNGLGANVSGPGAQPSELTDGYAILHETVLTMLNDTDEEWTINRVEGSPYAFSKSGKWMTYEDQISAANKARYVLDNDIGGVLIFTMEMDDYEGASGVTFPIIRSISDTFKQSQQAGGPSP